MNNPLVFSGGKEDKISSQYRGKVISIKIPRNPLPILCIIQRSDMQGLYFDATDEFLKSNVFLGDPLICQIMENDSEYVLEGIIGNIDMDYPREVQFLVERITKFRNKRKCRRYIVNFSSAIYDSKNGRIYSIARNISLGGVNMVFKEQLKLESQVDVEILISKDKTVSFKAKVRRILPATGFYEYGMEIISIDDANKDLLEKVILELQQNESKFIENSLR